MKEIKILEVEKKVLKRICQNFFNDLDDYILNYKELEKEYNYL